ncbi:MAG TPA: chromosome segregation protein SMC [Acidimicrobiales bacterium]|nr:chromosome segregation protein SMC [Acidimicrobiales bacterium]
MFLKTLSLKGFKSFADSTALELEPGVTVVVGPNGSGKSNVVDAIAWVLGAQAPSAVRSQKMDDVIFAGTAKRPALGRAEVSLTIDNSAGLLPIDFTEVTITRTLFRTGDSEYAINGVPCRMLDIQELLSDTGVGRQQHVIVSQGQIDAVLNARPEDRRLILEEAAGVLKYRKRKEKAERRLAATEGNLTRLGDLLREVRRQLRPLERQADAARRHGDVVAELRALRLFLAGRELTTLRRRLADGGAARAELATEENLLRKTLAELDTAVLSAEAELGQIGGDDLGDALVRFESLREKARGLAAVLTERRRGIDRERGAFVDQAVIASLEADAARLARELADAEAEQGSLAPAAEELARAERALADARASYEERWAEGVPAPSGRAAEARGELAALRKGVERGEAELTRARSRLASLEDKLERLAAEATRLQGEAAEAEAAQGPLVERLRAAEEARAAAEVQVADAEAALRAADADRHAWSARAEALSLALDQARTRAGAERLASVDGVVGTLLDLVDIDEGWEDAVEAAAGEALAAVVVDGVEAARAAIAALADGDDLGGAVLALGARRAARTAPPIGQPVRRHVRAARPDVEALLDALIGHAAVVDGGWTAAVDAALEHPDAVIVTPAGGRFGVSGWRVGTASTGATGAALEEARERAASATDIAKHAEASLHGARSLLDEARHHEAALSRQLDEQDGRLTGATTGLQRLGSDHGDAATEAESLRSHSGELAERLAREQARVAELELTLPLLEAEEADSAEQARAMAEAKAHLDERAATVGSLRADLDVRTAGLVDRQQFLRTRLSEVEARLEGSMEARREAEVRRVELDAKQRAIDSLAALVADRLATVETELAELRERRRRQSEAQRAAATRLDGLRHERQDAERRLEETRERARRAELEEAEVKLRLETAVETLRRDLDVEPEVAMATEPPPLDERTTPAARVRELERDLRLMGPINPLALEEYEALQERHTFLQEQLDDVKSSRRDLSKVIKAIDAEIVDVFAGAFADVSQNFEALFQTLFPGGTGRLRLTDPDNLLETGIEVEAKPSGKNVRKLSLLSGGERSLTALAFLFAVFRSRPSPFYVMDEVEAALDDMNLHRFLDLVHEFRREAQLIIVSHQKRTMEAADILYGVTMQPGGSSKVVSEKVTSYTGG